MNINSEKFKTLVLHIANSPYVNDLGKVKLWKLIYFIDTNALRETGQTITGSEYIKYEHGPVPSRGDKILKQMKKENKIDIQQEIYSSYRINKIVPQDMPETNIFSEEEISLIDKTCQNYGVRTAGYLSEVSHDEPAWHYAKMLNKLSPKLMFYGAVEDPEGL